MRSDDALLYLVEALESATTKIRSLMLAAPQPETVGTVCRNCDLPVNDSEQHRKHDGAGIPNFSWICTKPAPCPTPEAGAASEMPEAIRLAAYHLRFDADSYDSRSELEGLAILHECAKRNRETADALEAFWRSQPAKPASVGMTPELDHVLWVFENVLQAYHVNGRGEMFADIAAVRAQASQPVEAKRVRLPKTLHNLECIRDTYPRTFYKLAEEALDELKREGIEG